MKERTGMRRSAFRHSSEASFGRTQRLSRRGSKIVTSRAQTPLVAPLPTFEGLSAADRTYLQDWRHSAKDIGIDAVDDMMLRPWPCPVADVIIGVFRAGDDRAAWLVIGHNDSWAVARCADGAVSHSVETLSEALSLIHPMEMGPGQLA
jgi:hypothetical protein